DTSLPLVDASDDPEDIGDAAFILHLRHYAHLRYGPRSRLTAMGRRLSNSPSRAPKCTRICSTWRMVASRGVPWCSAQVAAVTTHASSRSYGKFRSSSSSSRACSGVTYPPVYSTTMLGASELGHPPGRHSIPAS